MDERALWPLLLMLCLLFGVMFIYLIRLRLELWANRRVITLLRANSTREAPRPNNGVTSMLWAVVLLLFLAQIAGFLWHF
jgi:preprotein translocase subunit SecY